MKTELLFSTLSKAVNRYLALDPASKQRLAALEGKAINITILPLDLCFGCIINENNMRLTDAIPTAAASIRGTPLVFLNMFLTDKSKRHRFFADDLRLEGRAELAQQMVALFDELEVDWEEYLACIAGDIPAYYTRVMKERVDEWWQSTRESFTQNLQEYIHEEQGWLPHREELTDFFNEVDALRLDVDRVEAKVQALLRDDE